MKAFNFFVGINDEKNSGRYLKKINELPNDRIKLEANRVYNIFILKNECGECPIFSPDTFNK